ncbi:hypothetical protein [Chamaesiphon minutus]|uniref:CYTH domain-containing protein n=1 Tax=Chamaesiphon minutus (strain ATCC 27169 / PCC 6605) TaxID=1173020 RepID=K9UHR9_CHAP6|nr:hypothetical protein [Chamaesiphon minutus]AFY94198.1 hypothetical protein Cha6605_3186 [Chamaesiphon minutus PCC 6605]
MNGTQTIELRWFYRGDLPAEIANWFDTLGSNGTDADARTDFYLQSSSPEVGIKIRQGNLEVKHLQQQFDKIDIDRFGESNIEQWSKWICHDRSAHAPATRKQGWIQVDKVRQQRFYRVEFSDPLKLIPISTPRKNAAAIELTTLQLCGQAWWTIACEYLGDNISIDRQFLPIVRALLVSYPQTISKSSISSGYPQWLKAIDRDLSIYTD